MKTTQTTNSAGGGTTGYSSTPLPGWSDLPDDILGNIRLKITSLRDRVRLAAVSKPWRASAARLPVLPATPLLLMSPRSKTGATKHLCGGGANDSWVLRVPDMAADKRLMGSHKGGWVATFNHRTRKLMLVNIFSHAEVGVCYPWPADPWCNLSWCPVHRVIFSDDPTSSNGCILATIANRLDKIALCKVGSRSSWTKHSCENKLFLDIAFCNGDLYGLMPDEGLVRFEIGTEEDGSPIVTSTYKLAIQRRHGPGAYERYIVELHGKPVMAIMTQWFPSLQPFFKIFELVDADTCEADQHKWAEVTSFGDYALFLGPGKSTAVHVPVGAERRGFERNHIYYIDATGSSESNLRGDEVYSLILSDSCLLYCREDQNIGDGLGRTGYYTTGWEIASMWLEPPDL